MPRDFNLSILSIRNVLIKVPIIKLTFPLFSAKKVEKQLAAENSTETEDSEVPEECDEEYDELEEGEDAEGEGDSQTEYEDETGTGTETDTETEEEAGKTNR